MYAANAQNVHIKNALNAYWQLEKVFRKVKSATSSIFITAAREKSGSVGHGSTILMGQGSWLTNDKILLISTTSGVARILCEDGHETQGKIISG